MKTLSLIVIFLLLAGCASTKSLEQLELDAAMTGDWSEVEKRERLLARRDAGKDNQCGSNRIQYCSSYAGKESCACITRRGLEDVFAGR